MDDGSPIRYLAAIFLMMLCAAYFAGVEISLASVSKIRMISYADDGNKRAKRVLYILNNFDAALTTLLIGTNIMHIGCASLATLFATRVWGGGSVGVCTVVVAIVIFLFAEMIPKCFAKAFNEQFALAVAPSMIVLMRLLKPFAWFFSGISRFISKPFRHKQDEPTVTEEELSDIIDTIVEEGELDKNEGELVQNALEFAGTTAKDIYTPWPDVVKLSLDMSSDDILKVIKDNTHSRFPVTGADHNVTGILQMRSYLKAYMQNHDVTLGAVMDDAHFVSADTPIDDLLPNMSSNKTHMSVVLDKSGVTLGVVTVEDILEELVGEIYDEDDPEGGAVQ